MADLNSQTRKTTEIKDNSVLPDASDFEGNATEGEASISSTLPDADETSESDRLRRPPQIGEGSDLSYLPNASEVDTSITEVQDISMSTRRSHSNPLVADDYDDDTVLPEDKSSFVSTENEDTADLPYHSDPDGSDHHESDVSTSTFIYKNDKAEANSAALPAAEDPGVGKVSTPRDRPVIDDFSNLSDAFDANVDSGSFDARPLVSTPTRQQISSFSDANHSIDYSTSDIKMAEGSAAETLAETLGVESAPESAVESSIVGSSTAGSSGDVTVTPSEDVKPSKILPTVTEMTLLTTFPQRQTTSSFARTMALSWQFVSSLPQDHTSFAPFVRCPSRLGHQANCRTCHSPPLRPGISMMILPTRHKASHRAQERPPGCHL